MSRRLLREPHVLAHELRTPLSILAGWYSLVRDGDVSVSGTPELWRTAMTACQEAIDRLNFIISQACDEATAPRWREEAPGKQGTAQLVEKATEAIERSRQLLARLHELRVKRPSGQLAPTDLLEPRRTRRIKQPSATG